MIVTYEEQISKILEQYLNDDYQIVIYPYGERGRQVKNILNLKYGVKESYIVDNHYKGDLPVINCEELLSRITDKMLILICCENRGFKQQIIESLLCVSQSKIVDVFPIENIYILNWQEKERMQQKVEQDEEIYYKLQSLVFENDNSIYSLLGNYEKDMLTEQFETFLVRNVKSICLQRAYSLLLSVLVKELEINDEVYLAGNAAYRRINYTYPFSVYEEICRLKENNKISEKKAKLIEDAYNMRLFTRFPGGHVVPGYEYILKRGIDSYILELKHIILDIQKEEQLEFYKAELVVIRALQELIKRYTNEAKRNYRSDINFKNMIKNCEYIIYNKPCNFAQALQLLWFSHEIMILEGNIKGISLGRVDQYLYPYYEKDLRGGGLDQEQAKALIYSFWKKFEFDRKALAFQNITIGGLIDETQDGTNPLTFLFLDAQMQTRANQPMLSLRVNKFTSNSIWKKALDVISTGMGVPALFNDEVVISAKQEAGIDKNDAINYSIVGCVEPTVGGKEYSHTEGLRVNVAKILELVLFNGNCPITSGKYEFRKKRTLESFLTFEDFYTYFKYELKHLIEKACNLLDIADISYSENWPAPYLSVFMKGTFEKGKDVTNGGSIYSNLSINFAGIANVVNALIAIKKLVFERNLVDLSELPMVLLNNFKEYENIKAEIENIPKFGNNNNIADELMKDITEYIVNIISQYQTSKNGKFQVGFYTVWLHAEMGKYMLASFDGREKGTALASSLSPAQGTDVTGPLAVFHSVCKTPMRKMANGMVLDLRFSPSFFNENRIEKLIMAIQTYFNMGGMEVQLNVVDHETLIQAQSYPDNFRDLLVRVSGFSTYFVELEKEIQDEIIHRYVNLKL